MGVNGPEEKRVNFAGVNFNANEVSSYGKNLDGLYYINFKDGTKVEYAQQTRGAILNQHSMGPCNTYAFCNFNSVFVQGGKGGEVYDFSSCQGGSITTYGDQRGDTIYIDHDCRNIHVIRDKFDYLDNEGIVFDTEF